MGFQPGKLMVDGLIKIDEGSIQKADKKVREEIKRKEYKKKYKIEQSTTLSKYKK